MKKYIISLLLPFFVVGVGIIPAHAATCSLTDSDHDGYFSDSTFTVLGAGHEVENRCDGNNFFGVKGYEPAICDCPTLREGRGCDTLGDDHQLTVPEISEIIDTNKYSGRSFSGSAFHPNAAEIPSNGIDENCDGIDDSANSFDVMGLVEKIISFLGWLVVAVSTAVLIWGGIMYATAAGDDEKIRKARKAMLGAIIGVLVGVLAAGLIGFVMDYFTNI
ncbi:putative metal-binding motif-containing protein [Candidatus Peregrinibacteria bacterium]|nr:MAG: putative metal-binding motif-containing protein [Candidatus Peregrinibacteria bacterium]